MFLELLLEEMLEVHQLLINIICCQHLADVVGGNLVEQRLSLLLHNSLDNCFELSHQGDRILLKRFQPLFNGPRLSVVDVKGNQGQCLWPLAPKESPKGWWL